MIVDVHTHDFPDSMVARAMNVMAAKTEGVLYPTGDGSLRNHLDFMDAAGIDFAAVNKRHFQTTSKRRVAMEAELMGTLDYFDGDRGVFVTISQEMIRRLELDEDDLDNVSRLGAQVEGIECSVTLREQPSGDWKASVRTGARVNAAELCARFGGGGHAEAAGCILYGMTLDKAKRAIREAVESLPKE